MLGLTFNETIVAICEFLEVTIHTILYLRQVYPAELFARRRKYDAPVFQARHPGLSEYIAGSVKSIGQELASGGVRKVVVVIKDLNDVALERFVFAIQSFLEVDLQNRDVPIHDSAPRTSLHQYFRSILVRLTSQASQLRDLTEEVSFCIVLEMEDGTAPSATPNEQDPIPWTPAVLQHTTTGVTEGAEMQMIRAVETGIVTMSLMVQESEEKIERGRLLKGKGKEIDASS